MRRDFARWKRARILVVEDDPGDQEIVRRALCRDGFQAELHVVADGKEAMEYLLHEGRYADPARAPRPDLVLLDLNLPGVSGKQVLEAMRADPALQALPVVVVTTSAREQDVKDSYARGCNSYVVKPLEAHRFIAALRDLYGYWFGLVSLPAS